MNRYQLLQIRITSFALGTAVLAMPFSTSFADSTGPSIRNTQPSTVTNNYYYGNGAGTQTSAGIGAGTSGAQQSGTPSPTSNIDAGSWDVPAGDVADGEQKAANDAQRARQESGLAGPAGSAPSGTTPAPNASSTSTTGNNNNNNYGNNNSGDKQDRAWEQAQRDAKDEAGTGKGDCKVSSKLGGKYDCSGAQDEADTASLVNMGTQAVGSTAVQGLGQVETYQAQQDGTQNAALKAAATTQKYSGYTEMAAGGANLALGVVSIMGASQYKSNEKELTDTADGVRANKNSLVVSTAGATASSGKMAGGAANGQVGYVQAANGGLTEKVIDTFELNQQASTRQTNSFSQPLAAKKTMTYSELQEAATASTGTTNPYGANDAAAAQQATERQAQVSKGVQRYANDAASEQHKAYSTTMSSGIRSVISGVSQAAQGMFNVMGAKELENEANTLATADSHTFSLSNGQVDPGQDQFLQGSTALSPGTATDPANATTDGNVAGNTVPTIDPPVNPDGQPGNGFMAGGGTPAGGNGAGDPPASGGAGSMGGASTAEAKPDPDNSQPRMADNRANSAYAPGGAGYVTGGVGADKGMDLSALAGLFAQQQKDKEGNNNILDYGKGRSPAGMEPYSLLGRDVNLFKRISERMTIKAKTGAI